MKSFSAWIDEEKSIHDSVDIQIQDKYGNWRTIQNVSYNQHNMRQAMTNAMKSQLAGQTKKARAVDHKTGALIDMQFGP